jgi:hypothetical protein
MDNVQWKFYIIPDYENDKSILVLKAHHSLGDGMGFAHFFLALSDDYNHKNLNALKSISWIKKIIVFILQPFLIIFYSIKLLFVNKDYNAIKKD